MVNVHKIVPENYEDFKKRHGGDNESVVVDHIRFFKDGASATEGPRGNSWTEPPENPSSLLSAQRQFLDVKLKQEIEDFDKFYKECQTQVQHHQKFPAYCPPPPANAKEQLERGKKRIVKLRGELTTIDEDIAKTPEAKEKREKADTVAKQREQVSKQWKEILEVSID